MSEDIKGNHFKLVKDVNQEVKDFIIECFAYPFAKNRKCALAGDMILGDTGVPAISPATIFVPHNFKEFFHILMAVDMPKKVEQEQTGRVITWPPARRGKKVRNYSARIVKKK